MFDYIPEIHFNPNRRNVKYLLRKRIFHSGWSLSYCYLPANEDVWIHLTNTATKSDALTIIKNSHH